VSNISENFGIVQAFASRQPEHACQALLFYMERCKVLDEVPTRAPGQALAIEVLCACLLIYIIYICYIYYIYIYNILHM